MLEVLILAFGVPLLLFGFLMLLARFEANLVQPGEHAAQVVELLHGSHEPDEVERATASMYATVIPVSQREPRGGR